MIINQQKDKGLSLSYQSVKFNIPEALSIPAQVA